jgi:glutaminyl-peptide cyclotransferase
MTSSSSRLSFALVALATGVVAISAPVAAGRQAAARSAPATAPVYGYHVVRAYPHDRGAFTQGLEYRSGALYEGTGLYGRSSLRKVKLETGEVLQKSDLGPELFGEGITVLDDRILQLTWKNQIGFRYEQLSFKRIGEFSYEGEGWGLANDGTTIYMSDGSAQIRFWDAKTLKETRRITVRDGNQEIRELNELEWIKGEIYANVWNTWRIARISPQDGHVIAWIDLTGILTQTEQAIDVGNVLNGIAYDFTGNRLFVTGKLWPKLFHVTLVPPKSTTRGSH